MTRQRSEAAVRPIQDADLTAVLDSYLSALRRGEHPIKETLLREHPHLAAELSGCLQTLDMLQDCANFDVDVNDEDLVSTTQRSLGDYHLLREVGRGGMGVVYEAEQISLSRRVALKILPFAAVLDPRHLQRFKNEAMAAAHLDHPNIVEVYGIGCERSIHFYAMRFIEGVTLADVVEAKKRQQAGGGSQAGNVEGRNPNVESGPNDECRTEVFSHSSDSSLITPHSSLAAETSPVLQAALSTVNSITPKERFRRIAEIGIQAAEALDHAHQMGIVHRDIKPSNLMLDERGKLWVTDFGLARNQGDASMTMTGDLVGTLRYMSPEQALAKRITVDHRTDIYSLGVTLYELLTLRAAFPSNDREETLRQIAFDQPKAPRKLDKAIPEELETIILKAMEKNPDDRYATARELAEDLRRWVEHKPIVARAPGVVLKAKKWARRHSAFTTAALGVLTISTLVLAVAVFFINRAYGNESAQREVAKREERLAKENLASALDAIRTLLFTLASDDLANSTVPIELRSRLLSDAQRLCESLRTSNSKNMKLGVMLLLIHHQMADIDSHTNMDSSDIHKQAASRLLEELMDGARHDALQALTLYEELKYAEHIARSLGQDVPGLLESLVELSHFVEHDTASSRHLNAELAMQVDAIKGLNGLVDSSRLAATIARVKRSAAWRKGDLELRRRMCEAYWALSMSRLGADQEELDAAISEYVHESMRHLEATKNGMFANDAVWSLLWQGDATQDLQLARSSYNQAVVIQEQWHVRQPLVKLQLAVLNRHEGRLMDAEDSARQSVDEFKERLQSIGAKERSLYERAGMAFEELAQITELQQRFNEVRNLYVEEIAFWDDLARTPLPHDMHAWRELTRALLAKAAFEFTSNGIDQSTTDFACAENELRELAKNCPTEMRDEISLELAELLATCPSARTDQLEEAESLLLQAIVTGADAQRKNELLAAIRLQSGDVARALSILRNLNEPSMLLAVALEQHGEVQAARKACYNAIAQKRDYQYDRVELRRLECQFLLIRSPMQLSVDEFKNVRRDTSVTRYSIPERTAVWLMRSGEQNVP